MAATCRARKRILISRRALGRVGALILLGSNRAREMFVLASGGTANGRLEPHAPVASCLSIQHSKQNWTTSPMSIVMRTRGPQYLASGLPPFTRPWPCSRDGQTDAHPSGKIRPRSAVLRLAINSSSRVENSLGSSSCVENSLGRANCVSHVPLACGEWALRPITC